MEGVASERFLSTTFGNVKRVSWRPFSTFPSHTLVCPVSVDKGGELFIHVNGSYWRLNGREGEGEKKTKGNNHTHEKENRTSIIKEFFRLTI